MKIYQFVMWHAVEFKAASSSDPFRRWMTWDGFGAREGTIVIVSRRILHWHVLRLTANAHGSVTDSCTDFQHANIFLLKMPSAGPPNGILIRTNHINQSHLCRRSSYISLIKATLTVKGWGIRFVISCWLFALTENLNVLFKIMVRST